MINWVKDKFFGKSKKWELAGNLELFHKIELETDMFFWEDFFLWEERPTRKRKNGTHYVNLQKEFQQYLKQYQMKGWEPIRIDRSFAGDKINERYSIKFMRIQNEKNIT